MSGRGGRGGRGASKQSLSREQLSSLGVTNNEVVPGPVTHPPPLYPVLCRKPVPLAPSLEYDYMLILKQDFVDRMQLSGAYLKMPEAKMSDFDKELGKLVAQLPNTKEKFDWKLFPTELRPKVAAKHSVKKTAAKEIDIDSKLSKLEKLEQKTVNKDAAKIKTEIKDEEDDVEYQDEEDEEMDDGTDYANNYFDNGEGYEDEDDNLDDGPIY